MISTDIRPAFDADLQPIGFALAAELLANSAPRPALPAGPDLFGWELAAPAHSEPPPVGRLALPAAPIGVRADTRGDIHQDDRPCGPLA
jgi:hypothetical protein